MAEAAGAAEATYATEATDAAEATSTSESDENETRRNEPEWAARNPAPGTRMVTQLRGLDRGVSVRKGGGALRPPNSSC